MLHNQEGYVTYQTGNIAFILNSNKNSEDPNFINLRMILVSDIALHYLAI
ncbi:MAG TPA: hypothetical protein VFR94_20885 [Nitrososphaeraceae archaeon]|nr:hypothetical protein [Nitrososphaeraceae archaeon]